MAKLKKLQPVTLQENKRIKAGNRLSKLVERNDHGIRKLKRVALNDKELYSAAMERGLKVNKDASVDEILDAFIEDGVLTGNGIKPGPSKSADNSAEIAELAQVIEDKDTEIATMTAAAEEMVTQVTTYKEEHDKILSERDDVHVKRENDLQKLVDDRGETIAVRDTQLKKLQDDYTAGIKEREEHERDVVKDLKSIHTAAVKELKAEHKLELKAAKAK